MQEITVGAKVDNIEEVTAFVDELLEQHDCSMRANMQINIALDEILSNIAFYAYPEREGTMTVRVEFTEDPAFAEIQFLDSGVPYNPLEKEDPDVTLSSEERKIGGLGIFMVKKTMDEMVYEYKDGNNILTIKKKIM